jgi:hypothetical protein
MPAQTKGTIAGSRIVGQGQLKMGTVIDPVPVTGFAENFSPIPRIAPPPFGKERVGACTTPALAISEDWPFPVA